MISAATTCALLLSVGLLCARHVGNAIWLCALQSLFAAAVLCASGQTTIAILAAVLNGAALPFALWRVARQTVLAARISGAVMWPTALAVVVAVAASLTRFGSGETLALGASVVLLGLLLIVRSPEHPARVVGLLSAQNGLVLVASAAPGLSLPTGLVVAIPLVPALAAADAWLHR